MDMFPVFGFTKFFGFPTTFLGEIDTTHLQDYIQRSGLITTVFSV